MFTGIIQSTGEIVSLSPRGDGLAMRLRAQGFFGDCKPGDSVANDGVCLSIESCSADEALFCIMRQTVENTAFKRAVEGSLVNLETPQLRISRISCFLMRIKSAAATALISARVDAYVSKANAT